VFLTRAAHISNYDALLSPLDYAIVSVGASRDRTVATPPGESHVVVIHVVSVVFSAGPGNSINQGVVTCGYTHARQRPGKKTSLSIARRIGVR